MTRVSLAQAKAHLSDLGDQVEAGASIDITRRGKPGARLTTIDTPRRPIDPILLRSLTERMPRQVEEAATFVRSMRDDDRY